MKSATIVVVAVVFIASGFIASRPVAEVVVLGGNVLKFLASNWVPFSFYEVLILGLSSLVQLVIGALLLTFGLLLLFGLFGLTGSGPRGEFTIGFITIPATVLFGGGATAGAIAGLFRAVYFTVFLMSGSQISLRNADFEKLQSSNMTIDNLVTKVGSAEIVLNGKSCLLLETDSSISVEQSFRIENKNSAWLRYDILGLDSLALGLRVIFYFRGSGRIIDSLYKEPSHVFQPNEWNRVIEHYAIPEGSDTANICFRVQSKKKYWITRIEILL